MTDINLAEKEIENYIENFKNLNLKSYKKGDNVKDYIEYFNNQFAKCFKNGFIPYLIQKHELFDTSFYRFRKFKEIKDFDNYLEYSYPRPENCTEIMRANLPRFPVFYCSHHPTTAILEMEKWNDNETKYVVSKWVKKNKTFQFSHIPTYPDRPEFSDILIQTVQKWANGNESYKNGLIKFLEFVGNEIIKDNDYSVSAYISYKYIYENNIDLLSYPSCIDFRGINFAISPNIIDKEIVLDRVYIVELGKERKITLSNIGVFNDNKVDKWLKADELNRDDDNLLTFLNDFSAKL